MQEGSEVKRSTSVQTGGLLSEAVAKVERVGGAVRPEVPCHRSTMQGILSEVQGLVERKDIIKVSVREFLCTADHEIQTCVHNNNTHPTTIGNSQQQYSAKPTVCELRQLAIRSQGR